MNPPAPAPRRRPPYWTIAALAALLVLPGAWPGIALLCAAGLTAAAGGARMLLTRRPRPRVTESPGSVALGRDADGMAVILEQSELAAHGIIVGASGAGKTTTLLQILSQKIRSGAPVVAIDLKGSPDFAARLRAVAERADRPFKEFSIEGGQIWNPLDHGTPTQTS